MPFRSRLVAVLILVACVVPATHAVWQTAPPAPDVFAAARRLAAEGSYALAHETLQKIERERLDEEQRRWLEFYLADALWRSVIVDRSVDLTRLEDARERLRRLIDDRRSREDQDLLWAEANESLADSYWTGRFRDWDTAWPFYENAMGWWARSQEVDTARERYLNIVWKLSGAAEERRHYAPLIQREILENALSIARSPEDVRRASYLLAQQLSVHADPREHARIEELFQAATRGGRSSELHDDALFAWAMWRERAGRVVQDANGRWRSAPDPAGALEIYRRIVSEFAPGESRFREQAVSRIQQITAPSLDVRVMNVFLPGSIIEYHINSANVSSVELLLHRVDLTGDVDLTRSRQWLSSIELSGAQRIESWTRTIEPLYPHARVQERLRIDRMLPTGAYVLEARGGGVTSRELILVTDIAVVTRSASDGILIYVTDARTGEPVSGAAVRVWTQTRPDHAASTSAVTGADGVAMVSDVESQSRIWVAVARGERQAFTESYSRYTGGDEPRWSIYAITDRPAYRPADVVQWKVTARIRSDEGLETPAGQRLHYRINDMRGTEITRGVLGLNAFGSAWDALPLSTGASLGMYNIAFSLDGEFRRTVGSATLFRVEEYKLPEFSVSVEPLPPDGARTGYRPGERIRAAIDVQYYFGGPVRGAEVEVVVTRRPFHIYWSPRHDYGWLASSTVPRHPYGGGEEIERQTLVTDASGRAVLEFTAREEGAVEYAIEARVTDSSRREVVGSGTIRVASQPFFADLRPERHLYRPGSTVELELRTSDANERPVATTGRPVITRERWSEVWLDPAGHRLEGAALEAARGKHAVFPPPPLPDQHEWRLIRRGYEQETVDSVTLATGPDGVVRYSFTPQAEGFYRFVWNGQLAGTGSPSPEETVQAETTVWVATSATTSLGYQPDGLQIIVDPAPVRAGTTVPVMIVAPAAGHHVLFTVETGAILERRVISMSGQVQIVEVAVDERFVPNVFLSAVSVRNLELRSDSEELVVPPVEHFLDVEVSADAEEYRPGSEGTLNVVVRDVDGNPRQAEVALSIVDESVFYIQSDLAADPRQFFYGDRRHPIVQMNSSLGYKPYALVDQVQRDAVEREREEEVALQSAARDTGVGGAVGGVIGEAIVVTASAPAVAPPPPPAPEPMQKMGGADEAQGEVRVRSDFRATALWRPDLVTATDGTATVSFRLPDSLTTWRATARAATTGSEFGMDDATLRTNEPVTARLQGPRFFVVGDVGVVSAVLGNHTEQEVTLSPTIEMEGLDLEAGQEPGQVTLAPGEERRIDWSVAARVPGSARVRIAARGTPYGDAMERSIPVYEHGIEKLVAASGKITGEASLIELDLPAERRSTEMTLQVSPSIATTMLDALPYLIEFPYGCTEQTMSRFLPAAIVTKTLSDLGLERASIASRIFGGVEAATRETRPAADVQLARLDAVVGEGLKRLQAMQKPDGSWGWWTEGPSDPWMTAYVLWGYAVARDGGIPVDQDSFARALQWTELHLVNAERQPELQAWLLHAVTAAADRGRGDLRDRAFANLWERRDALSSYGRALLALSAHEMGRSTEAATLVRNLENAAVHDRAPDTSVVVPGQRPRTSDTMATVHWGSAPGTWWRWYQGPVESTAFVLRALVTIDPDHRLVEPAMNWLVKNRRGAQWSNTRDTAISVLALNTYLRRSGELSGESAWTFEVNGVSAGSVSFTAEEILGPPTLIRVPDSVVRTGSNQVRIRRSGGSGPLYFAAAARFFSLEEPVKAEGHELFVRREYYRLIARPTLLSGVVEERVPLRDGESIVSGERVEVVLTVETKNDYEYLVFEDLKPAGLEAVDVRSGEPQYARRLSEAEVSRRLVEETRTPTRPRGEELRALPPTHGGIDQRWVHQELRDRLVAMFADRLPQGVWEMRYTLRAEVPGRFHALPLTGQAMYVPEIRANGDELRLVVEENQ